MERQLKLIGTVLHITLLCLSCFFIGGYIRRSYMTGKPSRPNAESNHHPTAIDPLYEAGNYLTDYASITQAYKDISSKKLVFVLAVSRHGCNLCLVQFFQNYREQTPNFDPQMGFFVMVYSDSQRSVAFLRGLKNDYPEVVFVSTADPIPVSWSDLAHPHLALASAEDLKVLIDKELDVSQNHRFDNNINWFNHLMRSPADTH